MLEIGPALKMPENPLLHDSFGFGSSGDLGFGLIWDFVSSDEELMTSSSSFLAGGGGAGLVNCCNEYNTNNKVTFTKHDDF